MRCVFDPSAARPVADQPSVRSHIGTGKLEVVGALVVEDHKRIAQPASRHVVGVDRHLNLHVVRQRIGDDNRTDPVGVGKRHDIVAAIVDMPESGSTARVNRRRHH